MISFSVKASNDSSYRGGIERRANERCGICHGMLLAIHQNRFTICLFSKCQRCSLHKSTLSIPIHCRPCSRRRQSPGPSRARRRRRRRREQVLLAGLAQAFFTVGMDNCNWRYTLFPREQAECSLENSARHAALWRTTRHNGHPGDWRSGTTKKKARSERSGRAVGLGAPMAQKRAQVRVALRSPISLGPALKQIRARNYRRPN